MGDSFKGQHGEELQRSHWESALQLLSKEHEGELVTIEVEARAFGDQHEAEKLPLAYLEYDPHDDEVSVAVGGRDGRFPVILRHGIEHPSSIAVTTEEKYDPLVVQVVAPDGTKTLITLQRRSAPPA
jgi:hypothetical protein